MPFKTVRNVASSELVNDASGHIETCPSDNLVSGLESSDNSCDVHIDNLDPYFAGPFSVEPDVAALLVDGELGPHTADPLVNCDPVLLTGVYHDSRPVLDFVAGVRPQDESRGSDVHLCPEGNCVPILDIDFWEANLPNIYDDKTCCALLTGLKSGVRVGRGPAVGLVENPNWPSVNGVEDQITAIIESDLAAGRLYGPFPEPPFTDCVISPLGAIPKRNSDKIRVIHDLSFPPDQSVNSMISKEDFSLNYVRVDDAVDWCRKMPPASTYMAKIDLKDAFKHVLVNPKDWHLLGFEWQGLYYFSKVLNFGLRSSPALFDVFASALEQMILQKGTVSSILRYVDDFLIIADSESICHDSLQIMIDTCKKAGFDIQPSKVVMPSRVVEFLGVVIDTQLGVLRISEDRMQEVKTELARWRGVRKTSKRKLLRLIGRLAFVARVVRYGRAFIARLIGVSKTVSYLHYRIRFTNEARNDIAWWDTCLATHNGVYIYNRRWETDTVIHVYSDASDIGLGAVCDFPDRKEWFCVPLIGDWQGVRQMSINWRELLAALIALNTWSKDLSEKLVIFHIDNSSVCYILNKFYSPIVSLMTLVREWCLIAEEFDIVIAPVYISTADNLDADDLSRGRTGEFKSRNANSTVVCTCPMTPKCLKDFPSIFRAGLPGDTVGRGRMGSEFATYISNSCE
jgi:hypothetical protein